MAPPLLIDKPDSIGSEHWLHMQHGGTQEPGISQDMVVVSGLAHYDEGTLTGHTDNDGWAGP